jgi:hypothetical protein
MPDLTPAEWFDQFPPNPAMDGHDSWCARHWGPAPVLGANGMGAATEVLAAWFRELAPKGSWSPAARQRQLEAAGHICCTLGDDRMHKIWGHWPPAKAGGRRTWLR